MIGKGDEEVFITGNILKYPCKEARFMGRRPKGFRPEAGKREEAPEPLRLARQIGERQNTQIFCGFYADSINSRHRFIFPIP